MILFLKNRTLSDPDRQVCYPSADIDFELAFLQAILVIIFRYYLIFWQNDWIRRDSNSQRSLLILMCFYLELVPVTP
jgi:hypothetical protein